MNLLNKNKKEFYDTEHKIEYKKTKLIVLKDVGFIALFFLITGTLVYSSINYWIKTLMVFVLYIIIGLKERNAIELENKFEILREFKNKLDKIKENGNKK